MKWTFESNGIMFVCNLESQDICLRSTCAKENSEMEIANMQQKNYLMHRTQTTHSYNQNGQSENLQRPWEGLKFK